MHHTTEKVETALWWGNGISAYVTSGRHRMKTGCAKLETSFEHTQKSNIYSLHNGRIEESDRALSSF